MQGTTHPIIRRTIPVRPGEVRQAGVSSTEIRQRLISAAQSLEAAKRKAFGRDR